VSVSVSIVTELISNLSIFIFMIWIKIFLKYSQPSYLCCQSQDTRQVPFPSIPAFLHDASTGSLPRCSFSKKVPGGVTVTARTSHCCYFRWSLALLFLLIFNSFVLFLPFLLFFPHWSALGFNTAGLHQETNCWAREPFPHLHCIPRTSSPSTKACLTNSC
jgi:hypothetical protein